jgi:hypothetical protein
VLWGGADPVVEFTKPAERESSNDDGMVTLRWAPLEKGTVRSYELQQSTSPDFDSPKVRYKGADLGSVLSGFAEGEYHFRVRPIDPPGDWSEPVSVSVEYISKGTVVFLLGIGVTVFFATIVTLLVGHFRKSVT